MDYNTIKLIEKYLKRSGGDSVEIEYFNDDGLPTLEISFPYEKLPEDIYERLDFKHGMRNNVYSMFGIEEDDLKLRFYIKYCHRKFCSKVIF